MQSIHKHSKHKKVTLLSEPPLRIGSFILEKLGPPDTKGAASENPDMSNILADILKRYDLLLVTEQRTGNETNIDRLIKRLNTVDRNSPFDFEESECICTMHNVPEHYCFFYRVHKLSVVDVHHYGRRPFTTKGWTNGAMKKTSALIESPVSGLNLCSYKVSGSSSSGSMASNTSQIQDHDAYPAPPSRKTSPPPPTLPSTSEDATNSREATSTEAKSGEATSTHATSEDTLSRDATTRDATSEDATSKDATSKDGTSKDGTSKDATSKDGTSKDATSKDATSKDGTSKDATSKDGTSKDGTSKDGTSKDGTSKDGTSKDATSKDATSKDATSKDGTSKDATSKDATSKDATSKDATSKDRTSEDIYSRDATSKGATSTDANAKDENIKEENLISTHTAPIDAISTDTQSRDANYKDTMSKETQSKDATSRDEASRDRTPNEANPGNRHSRDETPKDANLREANLSDKHSRDADSRDAPSKDAGSKDDNLRDAVKVPHHKYSIPREPSITSLPETSTSMLPIVTSEVEIERKKRAPVGTKFVVRDDKIVTAGNVVERHHIQRSISSMTAINLWAEEPVTDGRVPVSLKKSTSSLNLVADFSGPNAIGSLQIRGSGILEEGESKHGSSSDDEKDNGSRLLSHFIADQQDTAANNLNSVNHTDSSFPAGTPLAVDGTDCVGQQNTAVIKVDDLCIGASQGVENSTEESITVSSDVDSLLASGSDSELEDILLSLSSCSQLASESCEGDVEGTVKKGGAESCYIYPSAELAATSGGKTPGSQEEPEESVRPKEVIVAKLCGPTPLLELTYRTAGNGDTPVFSFSELPLSTNVGQPNGSGSDHDEEPPDQESRPSDRNQQNNPAPEEDLVSVADSEVDSDGDDVSEPTESEVDQSEVNDDDDDDDDDDDASVLSRGTTVKSIDSTESDHAPGRAIRFNRKTSVMLTPNRFQNLSIAETKATKSKKFGCCCLSAGSASAVDFNQEYSETLKAPAKIVPEESEQNQNAQTTAIDKGTRHVPATVQKQKHSTRKDLQGASVVNKNKANHVASSSVEAGSVHPAQESSKSMSKQGEEGSSVDSTHRGTDKMKIPGYVIDDRDLNSNWRRHDQQFCAEAAREINSIEISFNSEDNKVLTAGAHNHEDTFCADQEESGDIGRVMRGKDDRHICPVTRDTYKGTLLIEWQGPHNVCTHCKGIGASSEQHEHGPQGHTFSMHPRKDPTHSCAAQPPPKKKGNDANANNAQFAEDEIKKQTARFRDEHERLNKHEHAGRRKTCHFRENVNTNADAEKIASKNPPQSRLSRKDKDAAQASPSRSQSSPSETEAESYDNVKKVFTGEPFGVLFISPFSDVTRFAVIAIHTDPSDARREARAIQQIYDVTCTKWRVQNIVLMGDFEMDESERGLAHWRGVQVKSDRRFSQLLRTKGTEPALNTKRRNFDRLVLAGRGLNRAFLETSAKFFPFDDVLNLTFEQAAQVSDHYPIEIQLAGHSKRRMQHVQSRAGFVIDQVDPVPVSVLARLCRASRKRNKKSEAASCFSIAPIFEGPRRRKKELCATQDDVIDVTECLKTFQTMFPGILSDTTISVASSFVTSPWMASVSVCGKHEGFDTKYDVTITVDLQKPRLCHIRILRHLCSSDPCDATMNLDG